MLVSCGVGRSSDPELMWLWCRLAASILIGLLAWELPQAEGSALKRQKKKKKKEKKRKERERENEADEMDLCELLWKRLLGKGIK